MAVNCKLFSEKTRAEENGASEIVQEVKRYTCLLRDYGEIAETVYYVRNSKNVINF